MNQQNTVFLLDEFQAKRKLRERINKASGDSNRVSAEVLPFGLQTEFLAVLALDELLSYKMLYSELDLQLLLGKISALLQREFGKRGVRRERNCFVLRHNQFESLVAGLLRVQFYSNMEDLPEFNIFGEASTQEGIRLTWGIGATTDVAELDLKRKQGQKKARRTHRGRGKTFS